MSTVDPRTHVRPLRTSTRSAAPTTSRLVGVVVTGLAGLTLATLVTGMPAPHASGTVAAPDWSATEDPGSTWSIARQVGAHQVWAQPDPAGPGRGLTGHGVAVAVVDTGVADVEGLRSDVKVVHAVDLSASSASRRAGPADGMGHGTHMAGLAAGRDSDVVPGQESDPERFVGMAPDATVVDVKVGGADGRVGVDHVVAGVDWVVEHADEHGIRVLNLSYSATDTDPAALVRLGDAVEAAWDSGVVVVVAAGNDGAGALTMPAAHPAVIAVGSTDHAGTATTADDRVGDWTNPGTAARRPDLLAPGKSVTGLRLPGSVADREHPEGLVTGDRSGRLFRGTGTSQSAAVVSGAAALLLQADPTLTPDEVRALLTSSARPLAADDSPVQGAGLLDVAGAVEQALAGPSAERAATREDGVHLLAAGADDRCTGWTGRSWTGRSWTGRSWTGRSWTADDWTADDWSGRSWTGRSWTGRSWTGRSWTADDWSGRSWTGRSWTGRSWTADDWSGRSWTGRSWTADGWSGRNWS